MKTIIGSAYANREHKYSIAVFQPACIIEYMFVNVKKNFFRPSNYAAALVLKISYIDTSTQSEYT